MAKLVVMYHPPKDQAGFEEYYNHVHIPLVQKLPDLKGAEVNHVLQTQNSSEEFYLFAQLHYENPQVLAQSLASPEGLEVQADVANLLKYLNKPPVISIVD